MIQNNNLETYKIEISKLAISNDIVDNLTNAKTCVSTIINKNKLKENEIVEIVKELKEHFKLEGTAKQELVEFSSNLFKVVEKARYEQAYQEDILKTGISNQKIDKIFPAIDYRENLGMIYAIKGYNQEGEQITYIGTGNKKIYEIARAKEFGIITTHEENIDTNLDLYTFANFVKNSTTIKASELFNRIKKFLQQFIIVSEEFYYVLVSYVMMTYVYILFQVIPYLWINGEKGTGKSTIMKLLNKLCFNSLFCSNINPANIFRQIDNNGSTIILDEFERMYGEEKQDIIKLLNQGFNKDGIVPRCVGQNNQMKKFRSFSPKIMGGISNIDDVLYERCIKYTTEKVKNVKVTKFKDNEQDKKEIKEITENLYLFGFNYAKQIKNIYEKEENFFKGNTLREEDLWIPILCIARIIDREQPLNVENKILAYAKKLSKEKFERYVENEPKVQLLYALDEYISRIDTEKKTLIGGKKGFKLEYIYRYLKNKNEFRWITSESSLGKKLTQWYGFDKKREKTAEGKNTYYIFDEQLIEEKMKEYGVTMSDFE